MSLKHELGIARERVPELHASIFRARQYPLAVWRKCDAEYEVL